MTGVEAVSDGVAAFREPRVRLARRTLSTIIFLLMLLLAGIAYLCRVYQIGATPPGGPGYQSVLSQLIAAVAGRSWFYFVAMTSILAVLVLQANTAFADFPRVCRAVAQNGFLPYSFASRGRRLVYSQGIYVLTFIAGSLLVVFRGVTDRLIPLFAVGAFLAFTFSQAGMVGHWRRTRDKRARDKMIISGVGATATGITVLLVMTSKFVEGAWITLVAIPAILLVMYAVRGHYDRAGRELASSSPLSTHDLCPPIVVVPIDSWSKIAQKALRFALTLSSDILVLQIRASEQPDDLEKQWPTLVEEPTRQAGLSVPKLIALESPYRFVVAPIVEYIVRLEREHPDRQVAVVIPQLVEKHWYEYFLHTQRSELLAALLLLKADQQITIVNVPWHLHA